MACFMLLMAIGTGFGCKMLFLLGVGRGSMRGAIETGFFGEILSGCCGDE